MKIKNYTLKFIALGKDKKTNLRYFCTNEGKGETYNMDCDVTLTPDQLQKINEGTLGGIIQDKLYEFRKQKIALIQKYAKVHNTFPPAEHLKLADKSVFSKFNIDYYINQYKQQLDVKDSTKRVYRYNLKSFKDYYYKNLSQYSIEGIVSENTINDYGRFIKALAKLKKKDITPTHIYNYQVMLIRFLNFVAKKLDLQRIDFFLKTPAFSSKWHIDEEDMQRLLEYQPQTTAQKDVLDIIIINKNIGLRIGEILNIEIDNITFDADACYIRFLEVKNDKERTVVVVKQEAIDIIRTHMQNNNNKYLWRFHGHNWFNVVLKEQIAKDVFKEETIKVKKKTFAIDGYVPVLKCKAISSHAFRRFAIERNMVDYGIDVARSLSGHSDTKIMFKHYADFMKSNDLKNKLLRK